MSFSPYFPHLPCNLGELHYKRSARNTAEHSWVLWKSALMRLYFSCKFKWNYIYKCTMQLYGIQKINALVKAVCCGTEYTVCSLVPNNSGQWAADSSSSTLLSCTVWSSLPKSMGGVHSVWWKMHPKQTYVFAANEWFFRHSVQCTVLYLFI
jgi:hypothetical protein